MKQVNKLLIVLIIIILLIFCIVSICIYYKKIQEFYKNIMNNRSVRDITGVERDQCVGHIPSYNKYVKKNPKLLKLCNKTKFNYDGEFEPQHLENIRKHNNKELCLTGCLKRWEDRRNNLYKLLEKIIKMCKKLDIPWVLYYGGLLGYYKNKELLPWDADLDILMPITLKDKFKESEKVVYEDSKMIFTIKPKVDLLGLIVDKETLLYCDVFYWKESNNNILVSKWSVNNENFLKIPKDKFFPIKYVNIKTLTIPVPNNIKYNLEKRYDDINHLHYILNNNNYYLKSSCTAVKRARTALALIPGNHMIYLKR